MTRVIIIDDHPIVLEGLKNLLTAQPDISMAGYFNSGQSALEGLPEASPDVILLDINLPDTSGIDLCREISAKHKQVKIIALSIHNERAVVQSMLQNGAHGYVLKNAFGEEILQGIREIMNGHTFLCEATKQALEQAEDDDPDQVPLITRREKEVLRLIGKGCTTYEIADRLFISPHTVESHRKKLMEKFGVNNIASVIRLAMEYRLL